MIHILFGFKYDHEAYRIHDKKEKVELKGMNYEFFPSRIFNLSLNNRRNKQFNNKNSREQKDRWTDEAS